MNYRLLFCMILLLAIVGTASADTLIKYIDAQAADRMMGRAGAARQWADLHDGAGTNVIDGSKGSSGVDISTTSATGYYSLLYRGGYDFNTSLIGSGSTISLAKYSISCRIKGNGLGSLNIGLTGYSPATPSSIVKEDYNTYGNTRYATDIAYASFTCGINGAYQNFTFNSDGLAAINKTGYTNLMLRFANDIDNSEPTWASVQETNYNLYGYADGGYIALLTVVYTTGGGGSAPVASFTCTKNFLRIPNSVTCTDSSTNTPTSWSWSMGDGSAAKTTQNVTYAFTKRGKWGITLNATNAQGSNVTPSATNVRIVGYENNY
jgi:hypothetical protein